MKTRISQYLIVFLVFNTLTTLGQTFTELNFDIPNLRFNKSEWIDFDSDGDLDIFLSGQHSGSSLKSALLYENDNGDFSNLIFDIPISSNAHLSWIDFDNDNDLDLIIAAQEKTIYLYENTGNDQFEDRKIYLNFFRCENFQWQDFNNDGLADLIFSGRINGNNKINLFRNDGNDQLTLSHQFIPLTSGSVAYGDYNNDGLLDLITTGEFKRDSLRTILYTNNGDNTFEQSDPFWEAIISGEIKWADINNDGYLDIIINGIMNTNSAFLEVKIKIFKSINGTGNFEEIPTNMDGTKEGCLTLGDYNNDGNIDIFTSGRNSYDVYVSQLYINNGNETFSFETSFASSFFSRSNWGDFDNDGDLDLLLTGIEEETKSKVYRNENNSPNQIPYPPTNLSATVFADSVELYWDAAQDSETPAEALMYNIRIGTAPGLSDVISSVAILNDGKRKIARQGNVLLNRRWVINGLLNGTYYWCVQTIDNAYSGSQFSAEQTFVISGSNNQSFIKINAELPGFVNGEARWGDYDSDGDLDVVATGRSSSDYGYKLTKIFRNDSGIFVDINAQLIGLSQSSIEWGDYDGDGDLDLLNIGIDSSVVNRLIIYKNQGNDIFTQINNEFDGFNSGDAEWGDYDNDGDLDFVVCGTYTYGTEQETKIYRNDGNDKFTMMDIQLQKTKGGTSDWGDYDNDGDLDIVIGGGGVHMTRIYNNDKSAGFVDLGVEFTGDNQAGPVEWGDYDADGDLDLLAERTLFKNNDGIFTKDIVLDVDAFSIASSEFGDLNNDGYLDILFCGTIPGVALPATKLFINNSGTGFAQKQINIAPSRLGNVDLGDYDSDGDLDILITGSSYSEPKILYIYKTIGVLPNNSPDPPNTFQSNIDSGIVNLSWNRGFDLETDSMGLSYNLKIGLSPEGQNFMPAHSNISNGKRYFAELGNVQQSLSWSFESKVCGNYYWAVQSIDNSFTGSAFSEMNQFTLDAIPVFGKDTIDFGEVEIGNSKIIKFSIFNEGNINLLLYTFELYSESIYVTPANGVINFGDSSEFSITFNPNQPGTYNGDLILQHNGLTTNTLIPIKAAAIDTLITPNVVFDKDTLDFGKVEIGKSKFLNFNIFNDGNSQLHINKIDLHSNYFSVSPENSVINIGDSSEFSITFKPDEPGDFSGEMVLYHNGLNLSTQFPIIAEALDTLIAPVSYSISQNYPNPFNGRTQINYAIPEPGWVKLYLFDVLGKNTSILINELKPIGYHTFDLDSSGLASGVYIYRLQVGNFIVTKKMIVLK